MLTAKKDAAVAMRQTDVVIEVLDARAPLASVNPLVEKLRRDLRRPALKLLNKADLADPERTEAWLRYFNALPDTKAIALSAKKAGEANRIPKECRALSPQTKALRMLIMGVPNAGKSTLMNTLLKRAISKVGDEPAITKGLHKHQLGPQTWLTDTPGMTWPGIEQDPALKLAALGSIGRNAYDEVDVAARITPLLLPHYASLLQKRFGAAPETPLLDWIAKRRSFLNNARAATALLNDLRTGALGRITLETP